MTELAVAEMWYGIEAVDTDILRLREIHIDPYWSGSIWVVLGEDRTLVVDTGTGIVPPAPIVETLSRKPIVAAALAHYYDHAGGWPSFEHRACHRLEAPFLADPPDTTYNFRRENRLAAVPRADYRFAEYAVQPAAATEIWDEGDLIDLGGRVFQVLHVPGRTAGSMALWDAVSGDLFAGETVFPDPLDRPFPPSDAREYETSLRKMVGLDVRRVFGGHFGPMSGDWFGTFVEREVGRY